MPKIIPSIDNAATRGARAAAMRTHRSMFQSLVLREPTPEQERYLRQVEEASNNYDRTAIIGGPEVKKWSDHNG